MLAEGGPPVPQPLRVKPPRHALREGGNARVLGEGGEAAAEEGAVRGVLQAGSDGVHALGPADALPEEVEGAPEPPCVCLMVVELV